MGKKKYFSINEINMDDLYHSIWQFREAYKRCFKPASLFMNHVVKALYIPAIVNLSFALELEMKYLSLIGNKRCLVSHNLCDLFNELPERYINDSLFVPYDFIYKKLHDYNTIFNDTRYSFQKKSFDINSKNFLEPLEERMFKLIEGENIK